MTGGTGQAVGGRVAISSLIGALVFVCAVGVAVRATAMHHTHGADLYVGDLTPGDDGPEPYECGTKEDPCDSLEHAVVHASAGDVLALANGAQISGPVTIDKSVTIEGARGPIKSVLKPAGDIPAGGSWLSVAAGANVAWKLVTFDGAGKQVSEALRYEGGGAVAESNFKRISAGGDEGVAISAVNGGVTVYRSTFSAIGRTGVLFSGAGDPSVASGNRLTGAGVGAESGIAIEAGARVAVRNNTFSGFSGTGAPVSPPAAITVRGAAPGPTEAEVVANDIRGGATGLAVDGAGGGAVVVARANAFVGNGAGVTATASVDARDNWWGCNAGPGAPGCDVAEGPVDDSRWLTLTLEASPREAVVAGTSAVLATLTRDSTGARVSIPSQQPIEGLDSGRPQEEQLPPMGFADGTSIAFSASGGFLSSPVRTVAGTAGSTLVLIGPPGRATVRASLDAGHAEVDVTVKPHEAGHQPAGAPAPSAPPRGTAGKDRLYGGRGPDTLSGLFGNDLLVGRAGGDRLLGGAGNDLVFGGDGDDLIVGMPGRDGLNGGPGNDLIVGSAGADRLVGGRGHDVLAGNRGPDRLRAADGEPGDVVACGPGFDIAFADPSDALSACERSVLRVKHR